MGELRIQLIMYDIDMLSFHMGALYIAHVQWNYVYFMNFLVQRPSIL